MLTLAWLLPRLDSGGAAGTAATTLALVAADASLPTDKQMSARFGVGEVEERAVDSLVVPSVGWGHGHAFATLPLCLPECDAGDRVGIAWPHLASVILGAARGGDEDLTAGSAMTAQLAVTTFGAAVGGFVLSTALHWQGEADDAARQSTLVSATRRRPVP
ncbi:MAG: hypothetical protein AB1430_12010 [Pseudomonadota bacterium]